MAARRLIVRFELQGLQRTVRGFAAAAEAAERLEQAYQRLTAAANQLAEAQKLLRSVRPPPFSRLLPSVDRLQAVQQGMAEVALAAAKLSTAYIRLSVSARVLTDAQRQLRNALRIGPAINSLAGLTNRKLPTIDRLQSTARGFARTAAAAAKLEAAYIRLARAAALLADAQKALLGIWNIPPAMANLANAIRGMLPTLRIRVPRGGGGGGGRGGGRQPQQPPSRLDEIFALLMTTRGRLFGAHPLIGRMLRVILPGLRLSGAGSAAAAMGRIGAMAGGLLSNPAGIALVAAVAAVGIEVMKLKFILSTLAKAAKDAADQIAGLGTARLLTGGTSGAIGALAAYGLDPGSIPQLARSLRQSLATDPAAISAARFFGVSPQMSREYGGTLDEAQLFLRAVEGLRRAYERDPREALRMARRVPVMEQIIPMMQMSRAQFAQMRRDAALLERFSTERNARYAADFNASIARIGTNFKLLKTAFGSQALSGFTDLANAFSNLLGIISRLVEKTRLVQLIFEAPMRGLAQLIDPTNALRGVGQVARLFGMNLGIDKDRIHTSALERNTAAIEKNTTTLLRPGRYGHGTGLMPSRMTSLDADAAVRSRAFRFGYFDF